MKNYENYNTTIFKSNVDIAYLMLVWGMVFCFNATPEARAALDALLASGEFRDNSEAISAALVNYNVIHQAVTKGGAANVETHVQEAKREDETHRGLMVSTSPTGSLAGLPAISGLFKLSTPPINDVSVIPAQAPATLPLNAAPNKWLWGQYNRYFPAKATCRALLHLLTDNPKGVLISEAVSKISHAACSVGDYLSALDVRQQRRREDSLMAAFPTSAITSGQSRLRYGNQFVGALKQGKLIGLPSEIQLIACDSSKEPRLILTQNGAEFAALRNPILDSDGTLPTQLLSEEEISFLLNHLRKFVPEEVSAFSSILDGIDKGADSPDSIDVYLRDRFSLKNDTSMTTSFLSTQRTGAISRMVELGLVARNKAGLRVTYLVTTAGKHFQSQPM